MTPLQKTLAISFGIALVFSLLEMAGTPLIQTLASEDYHPDPENQRTMFYMQLAGGAATLPVNTLFIALTHSNLVSEKISFYLAFLSVVGSIFFQATLGKSILDKVGESLNVELLDTYSHPSWESEDGRIFLVNFYGIGGGLLIAFGMLLIAIYAACLNPYEAQMEQGHGDNNGIELNEVGIDLELAIPVHGIGIPAQAIGNLAPLVANLLPPHRSPDNRKG